MQDEFIDLHYNFKHCNINHQKKVIFLHIPKCAGKTVEHLLFGRNAEPRSADHRLPYQYIEEFGEEVWNEYFKCAFVRNPFDKLVSSYLYRKARWKNIGKNDFRHYVHWKMGSPQDYIEQTEWTISNGKPIDFIGRVENFTPHMNVLLQKLNYHVVDDMPKLNQGSAKPHYSTYYDNETIELVSKMFKNDLQEFGYQFEDRRTVRK